MELLYLGWEYEVLFVSNIHLSFSFRKHKLFPMQNICCLKFSKPMISIPFSGNSLCRMLIFLGRFVMVNRLQLLK